MNEYLKDTVKTYVAGTSEDIEALVNKYHMTDENWEHVSMVGYAAEFISGLALAGVPIVGIPLLIYSTLDISARFITGEIKEKPRGLVGLLKEKATEPKPKE